MVDFEHTLFQLLLLVGLLNAKPPHQKYTPYILGVGMLLAFLPPVVPLPIPWGLILGLMIPLLIWQNARRLINAGWRGGWKALLLWGGAALLFGLLLNLTHALELTGAILFGLIAASAIWRSCEPERASSFISQIGPLTLVFLLSEIEPLVETPTHYLGGIFSGASFGLVIGLSAGAISQKYSPKTRNWIALGQVYLAYGFANLAGVSAVTAALVSVIVYVVIGLIRGFWRFQQVQPAPFNTWPGFSLFLAIFLVLGWQSHQPISMILLIEVVAGSAIGLFITWVGSHLKLSSFRDDVPLWPAAFRITLLLFPAILLWPRGSLQEPVFLAAAFGIAGIFLIVSRLTLDYFFEE